MLLFVQATKGDKSVGMEELSDDVFCKLFHYSCFYTDFICLLKKINLITFFVQFMNRTCATLLSLPIIVISKIHCVTSKQSHL